MSSPNFVTNVAGYCCTAMLAVVPVTGSSTPTFNSDKASYYTVSMESIRSNTNSETKVSNIVDIFEVEAKLIVDEINLKLDLEIDDTFIPNKSENNTTLFITCEKFRTFCSEEKYEEAYTLEMEIASIIKDMVDNTSKIGRIAFL